ncbi:MAG: ATP phosphoribosyltransferase regulatory subunit, partial [Candidatus Omnitrophota bacterium]|nr:ATP phosphoribosyltransferase regulatory subunit [Candidatus Omnitrophota bacterium]
DNLVEKFGKKCSATGFSIGINMIMTALDRQKIECDKLTIDSLVCYKKEGRKTAFCICEELRSQGLTVEMDITGYEIANVKKYAQDKGIGGIFYVLDSDNIEVHNIETGEISKRKISEIIL